MKKLLRKFRFELLLPLLTICAVAAVAVQTPLTPINLVGPYTTGQPTAGSLAVTVTGCDTTNGNSFPMTGRDILLVQNTDSAAHTFTVSSVADAQGRTQDVTAYSVGATSLAAYSFRGSTAGWQQSDGTVHLSCSNSMISFAVIRTNQ